MIDMKKTYRTRDGREVRIYAVDGKGDFCVHGAVNTKDGWVLFQWLKGGSFVWSHNHPRDLIEVKPRIKRTVWVNVYPERYENEPGTVATHPTKKHADQATWRDRLACVKIEIDCEEGEGL